MAGVKRLQRKSFSANDDIINTSPAKWPGNLDIYQGFFCNFGKGPTAFQNGEN